MNRFWEKIIKILSGNNFLLIFAMLSSIVIWFYVAGIESPETTKTFTAVTLISETAGTEAETNGLMLLKGAPKTINVVLSGSRSDLATFNRAAIIAKLDFNAITTNGNFTIPVKITLPDDRLKVVSASPSNIDVVFSVKKTVSAAVKVYVTGNVSENYIADTPRAYPTTISISGPDELVATIASAVVTVDITKATETLVKKSTYTLVDKDGNLIDMTNITTDTDTVNITCPVLLSKSIPTAVSILNSSGGADSKFAIVEISPKSIIVGGTTADLSAINSLELGSIDMSEVPIEGIEKDFELKLPNSVKSFDTAQSVHVKITYPKLITKTFTIKNFSFVNTPTGKTAAPVTASINLTVRGLATDIAALTEDNIKAVVDLSDVSSTGKIQHTVTFEFPTDAKVGAYGKYTALIKIS